MPSFFFSTSHLTVDSISYWILITYILCGVRYPTSLYHTLNPEKMGVWWSEVGVWCPFPHLTLVTI